MTATIDNNSVRSNKNQYLFPNNDPFFNVTKSKAASKTEPQKKKRGNRTTNISIERTHVDVFGTDVLDWDPWDASRQLESGEEENKDNNKNKDDLDKMEENETVRAVKTKTPKKKNKKKVVRVMEIRVTKPDDTDNSENGEEGTVPIRDDKDNDDTKESRVRSSSNNSIKGRGRRILSSEEIIMKRRSRSSSVSGNYRSNRKLNRNCTDNISRRSRSRSIQRTAAEFVTASTCITDQKQKPRSRSRQSEGHGQDNSTHQRSQSRSPMAIKDNSTHQRRRNRSESIQRTAAEFVTASTSITDQKQKPRSRSRQSEGHGQDNSTHQRSQSRSPMAIKDNSTHQRSQSRSPAAIEDNSTHHRKSPISSKSYLSTKIQKRVHGVSDSKNRRSNVKNALAQFLAIDDDDDDDDDININTTLRSRELRIGGKKNYRPSGNRSVASAPTAVVADNDNNKSITKNSPRSKSHGPSRRRMSLPDININTTTLDTQSEHIFSSSKPKFRSRELRIGGKKSNQLVASAPKAVVDDNDKDKSITKNPPRSKSHGSSLPDININTTTLDTQSEHIFSSSKPKFRSRELRIGGKKSNQLVASAPKAVVDDNDKDKSITKNPPRSKSHGSSLPNININTTTLDTQSEHISSSSKPKLRSREPRIGGKKSNRSVASAPTAVVADNDNNKSITENPPRSKSHGSSLPNININTTTLDTQSEHISSSSNPKLRSREPRIGGKKSNRVVADNDNNKSITENPPQSKSHGPSRRRMSLPMPTTPRRAEESIDVKKFTTTSDHDDKEKKDEKERHAVNARVANSPPTSKTTRTTMKTKKSPSSLSKSYLSAEAQKRVTGSKKRRSNVKDALGQFLDIDGDDIININPMTLDTQSEHISSSSKPKLRSRELRIGGKKPSRPSGN